MKPVAKGPVDLSTILPGTRGGTPYRGLSRAAEHIVAEWLRRKNLPGLTPYESALGYLKRECYRVVRHVVDAERSQLFEQVIRLEGRSLSAKVKIGENPFHYGLRALFSDDSVISAPDRSVYSVQMMYAYRHGIEAEMLIGFIYQSGSSTLIRAKLKSGYIEPGFVSKSIMEKTCG